MKLLLSCMDVRLHHSRLQHSRTNKMTSSNRLKGKYQNFCLHGMLTSPCSSPGPRARTLSAPPWVIGPTVNWKGLPEEKISQTNQNTVQSFFLPQPALSQVSIIKNNNNNNNNLRVSNIRVSNRTLIYNVCPKSALT